MLGVNSTSQILGTSIETYPLYRIQSTRLSSFSNKISPASSIYLNYTLEDAIKRATSADYDGIDI